MTQSPDRPPVHRRSRLLWIVGGLVVVLIAAGLGFFLVLNDDQPTPTASTSSQPGSGTADTRQSAGSSEPEGEPSEPDEGRPEGTDANGNPLTFAGSPETAGAFLDLMTAQDYDSAYALLTENLRNQYPDALTFADEFLAEVGASAITSWEMSAAYAGDDHDEISFLDTDGGNST